MSAAKKFNKTHCHHWLNDLAANGVRPDIVELEASPQDEDEAEIFWIGYFRFLGARLTNIATGGQSNSGWTPSLQVRAVRSETAKQLWRTRRDELRNKISCGLTGHKHSNKTKEKIREKALGRVWSDDQKQRQSAVAKARGAKPPRDHVDTKEFRDAAKLRMEKRWGDPISRAALLAAQRRARAERQQSAL